MSERKQRSMDDIMDAAGPVSRHLEDVAFKLTEKEGYCAMAGCPEVDRIRDLAALLAGAEHVLNLVARTRNGYVSREVLDAIEAELIEAEETIAWHEKGIPPKRGLPDDEIAF